MFADISLDTQELVAKDPSVREGPKPQIPVINSTIVPGVPGVRIEGSSQIVPRPELIVPPRTGVDQTVVVTQKPTIRQRLGSILRGS